MKKRLTGKPACMAILAALVIISLADVILRSVIMKEAMLNLANAGEPIITALFSLMLILFANKGKDRLFYILCGALLGYFVLSQLFELPGTIAGLISLLGSNPFGDIVIIFRILSIICIVVIGGLLVEYMNDGTIYNKAFNILCIATILMLSASIVIDIFVIIIGGITAPVFSMLNSLSRVTMVFLFVFYAYDTAKRHLAKTKL